MTTLEILQRAKAASPALALLSTNDKNRALLAMADALEQNAEVILEANEADILAVKDTMNSVMIDRLRLTKERIAGMAQGIREVVDLPDPVGSVIETVERPNGLRIEKTRVPMGVVGIIYESRPNVTSDAAALALKSGNVCVLRGGKEAYRSSYAIVTALRKGLEDIGIDPDFVNMLE
ncbi:MAG: aldehyde dehydrogenase family protein, partial [Clostridia bacterium]|nr:aldehyde dehydrogenase family protein [Clostridia bacterium]